MNLSSQVPPTATAAFTEPPLSPGAPPAAVPSIPSPAAAPTRQLSIEAQVVRLGLMTPDQVATLMLEEAESGRTFDELAIEHEWISADDLARVRAPAKLTAVPSAPVTQPDPAPASTTHADVFVRLTSGERLAAGAYDTQEAAEQRAKELMEALDAHGDWPCLEDRYIRPDAVVSIDVDLTGF